MNAKFIIKSLASSWKWNSNEDFAVNVFIKSFESDFITITKAGYMHEIEVKVDRGDFRADFKKISSKWNPKLRMVETLNKHGLIKTGEYGLKLFSFATPKGLLKPNEVPDYCGHYEVIEGGGAIHTVRAPKPLPNPKKMTPQERHKLHNFYKWRWRKQFFKEDEK